jgi:hypothetical protein
MDDFAIQLAPHTREHCLMLREYHRAAEKVPLPPCPYEACS